MNHLNPSNPLLHSQNMQTRFGLQSRTVPSPAQQGIVLFIVMIIVLITSLLVLWASRSSFFNEIVTGNEADYQRAFEAAQAMLRDAEMDISETRADGTAIPRCPPSPSDDEICRPEPYPANIDMNATEKKVYFPYPFGDDLRDEDGGDLMLLQTELPNFKYDQKFDNQDVGCIAAICIGNVTESRAAGSNFWNDAPLLAYMKTNAATYGKYTGAVAGEMGNPLLDEDDVDGYKAWYWVEPLFYVVNLSDDASMRFTPRGGGVEDRGDIPRGIVYRITAYVEGRKPGTQVVLQNIYVRQQMSDTD